MSYVLVTLLLENCAKVEVLMNARANFDVRNANNTTLLLIQQY